LSGNLAVDAGFADAAGVLEAVDAVGDALADAEASVAGSAVGLAG